MKKIFKLIKQFGFWFTFKYVIFKNNQKKRNNIVYSYLEKRYSHFIKDMKFEKESSESSSKKIWMFWYTGIESAPEIVKTCVKSIEKASKPNTVVIIDKNNIGDYVEIPKFILDKVESGEITLTHFSDILRMSLLEKHGGLWADATIFYTGENTDEFLNKDFFTIKKESSSRFITNDKWSGYFMACNKGNKLVSCVKNLFLEYWKENKMLIDYFLIDFFICLAYNHDEEIKKMMDNNKFSNPETESLVNLLNEEYNEEKFLKLTKQTNVFKLSWKKEFINEIDGKETFYGRLINKK